MEVEINKNQSNLELKISGNIDSVTAPQLEAQLKQNLENVDSLTMDFAEVDYISSAGLRVLIFAKKNIDDFKLLNISEDVRDVFEMTGFDTILGI